MTINDVSTEGKGLEECRRLLRGEAGAPVFVRIYNRDSDAERDIRLWRVAFSEMRPPGDSLVQEGRQLHGKEDYAGAWKAFTRCQSFPGPAALAGEWREKRCAAGHGAGQIGV